MSAEPDRELVRSQHGADLLIHAHGPTLRTAQVRQSEREPWRPATYEDLLDFILGKTAPAEEPREVVEPKSAVGLAVEELRRREVDEPAPAPARRLTCKECCQDIPASEVYAGTHFRPDQRTGGRWPCGPVEFAPEPAPDPARWRCERCGCCLAADEVEGRMHMRRPVFAPDDWPEFPCGPVVPVGEAGS